jgi:hypothetical protein
MGASNLKPNIHKANLSQKIIMSCVLMSALVLFLLPQSFDLRLGFGFRHGLLPHRQFMFSHLSYCASMCA